MTQSERTRPESALPELLRVAEAAKMLAVDERTLRGWIAARKIAVVRLSARCLRIRIDDLERFIAERCDDGTLK